MIGPPDVSGTKLDSTLQRVAFGATFRSTPWLFPHAFVPFLAPLALFLLWTLAARYHWMAAQILPAPSLVWDTGRELLGGDLLAQTLVSLERLALGLGVGVLAGVILGAAMGASQIVEAALYPTFIAISQVPTLAWIPLFIMIFGLGEALKVAVTVKAVVTPVTLHVQVGVRDVDPKLRETASVLRLRAWLVWCRFVLPSALPSFMTGLRLALAQGWTALLVVELLASSEGIGFLTVWGRQLFQLDIVFMCIIVIGTIGLTMDLCLQALDRLVVRWPRPPLAQYGAPRRSFGPACGLVLPLAVLALWSESARHGWIDSGILPSPGAVLSALIGGFRDLSLPLSLAASLQRTLLGFFIGAGSGVTVGAALGLAKPLARAFGATLTVLRIVAIFAWLPLLTAWAGLGEAAKVTFVALACFFPAEVATEHGIANLSPLLDEAARVLRLGIFARLRFLVLPGAAAAIFAGLRQSLVQAWIGAMGAEFFMPSGLGIGSLMVNAQQLFRAETVVSGMILIGLTATGLAWVGQRLEARATAWRRR